MNTAFVSITPALPSSDINGDITWHEESVGFKLISGDKMYAIMKRDNLYIHLQWHADTEDNPLLGGSVIKIFVKDIQPIFNEFVKRKTVNNNKLTLHTSWETNECGFYDLNKNAIFFLEDL